MSDLPPMPSRVTEIQKQHSDLMEEVSAIVEGYYSVNAQQALTLAHIGDDEPAAKDITRRGYYVGTNASYTLSILEERGFLNRTEDKGDRRKVIVRLTPRGLQVASLVRRMLAAKKERAVA